MRKKVKKDTPVYLVTMTSPGLAYPISIYFATEDEAWEYYYSHEFVDPPASIRVTARDAQRVVNMAFLPPRSKEAMNR